jgi:hypothetical protein
MSELDLEKSRQLAARLAEWDKRIVEIVITENLQGRGQNEKTELICVFDPEPQSDAVGYFWIANLLTRMEFEDLEVDMPFDLGFTIGREVFSPNGEIHKDKGDHIILWANHGE